MSEAPARPETASGALHFGRFRLDPGDRLLECDGVPVELNARYLDALILLAREPGKLISKDRFHQEVWRGVPVTDEALTQCIKTLRRQLGDDAGNPRFIETIPKHGYRFIAAVEAGDMPPAARQGSISERAPAPGRPQFVLLGAAGTVIRGHEFHYALLTDPGADEPLADLADGQGTALGAFGGRRGKVSGTFFHAIARG